MRILFGLALLASAGGCSSRPVPPPFKSSAHSPGLTFLDPQGFVATAQRAHLIDVVLLLLIVVLPVLIFVPLVAWRYRYNGRARYTPNWTFFWPLEFLVWGVPFAIVVVLAVWLWESTQKLDPYAPLVSTRPPLEVDVVGYDWKWLFIYPKLQIASIGEVAFPADRPLAIHLTSKTVMQSFFIPALGSQIYAMPGMVTKLNLMANAPGSFRGENTQFSGKGFYEQKFTAKAMTAADFKAWVARVRSDGIPLSNRVYGAIGQRNTLSDLRKALGADRNKGGPLYFADVRPNLFASVVDSFMGAPANSGSRTNRPVRAGRTR